MTIKRSLILAFFSLFFILAKPDVSCAGLLDNCIKGFDFGNSEQGQIFRITPMNKECYEKCEESCNKILSRKSPPSSKGNELNLGAIYQCNKECRSGGRVTNQGVSETRQYTIRQDFANFTASTRLDTYTPQIKHLKVQVSSVCSQPVTNLVKNLSNINAYNPDLSASGAINTKYKVEANDRVRVTLAEGIQKVHRCGKKNVRLVPIMRALDSGVWIDTVGPKVWTDKTQHECFMSLTDAQWAAANNFTLWSTKMGSDVCSWHSRNPNYVDTGIYVKDGDDLSLIWDSDLSTKNISFVGFSLSINLTRKDIFLELMNPTVPAQKALQLGFFENMGKLYIHPALSNALSIIPNNVDKEVIEGEKSRIQSYSSYEEAVKMIGKLKDPDNQNVPVPDLWKGLFGSVQDTKVIVDKLNTSGCEKENITRDNYNDCHKTSDPGLSNYNYSGKLSRFSSSKTPLGIKHPNLFEQFVSSSGLSEADLYLFHLGGVSATIDWGGCPAEDGVGLQYCVYLLSNRTHSDWRDVPKSVLEGTDTITIPSDGELVFRIAPLKNDGASFHDDSYLPTNYFGDYRIKVKTEDRSTGTGYYKPDGPIRDVVQTVHNTLYGELNRTTGIRSGGVVERLYNNVIRSSTVIRSIQAFLTLYLAFVGLGFIIGTIEMKQQDLIYRVIKIAFVLAVIDPLSWRFFYDYFFSAAIEGGIQLMTTIVIGSLDRFPDFVGNDVENDPNAIFSIFDGLISQLGSKEVWWKIGTLLFLGFIGFALMLIIIIAIGFYALAVLKAALTYMMSLVIVSILLFTTPLFLPMVLFQTTKSIFDNWWKMIVSFTLQPIGLFAGIAIFNTLFAATIYATLSYTICQYCAVAVDIPGIDVICLLKWYQPIQDSFTPDDYETSGFSTPIGLLQGSIILLILGHGMLKYCDFVTKLVGNIVSGELTSRSSDASQFSGQAGAMMVSGANSVVRAPIAVQEARQGAAWLNKKFQKGASKTRN